MARFYADEDFPGPVVQILRNLGHQAEAAPSGGSSAASCRIGESELWAWLSFVIATQLENDRTIGRKRRRGFPRTHEEIRDNIIQRQEAVVLDVRIEETSEREKQLRQFLETSPDRKDIRRSWRLASRCVRTNLAFLIKNDVMFLRKRDGNCGEIAPGIQSKWDSPDISEAVQQPQFEIDAIRIETDGANQRMPKWYLKERLRHIDISFTALTNCGEPSSPPSTDRRNR